MLDPTRAGRKSPHWTFERNDERVSVKVQGPFATNNSESLRDAVLAGWEFALLPDFSAWEAIGRGLVQELLPEWRPVDVFAGKSLRYSPLCAARIAGSRDLSRHLKTTFS